MPTNPVNWFEIPVTDLKRAQRFYESVFNLRLSVNDFGPLMEFGGQYVEFGGQYTKFGDKYPVPGFPGL